MNTPQKNGSEDDLTTAQSASTAARLDDHLLADLLSNETARISRAVKTIQSRNEKTVYIDHLLSVIGPDTQHPVSERVSVGEALGDLGDPRFREDAWFLPDEPLLGFVEVPEGPFLMGSDETIDKHAAQDEQPQHDVSLPTFLIGRYAVTVAQFRVFAESTGFKLKTMTALDGKSNHPVGNVTWEEALAYCSWLNEKLSTWENTPTSLAKDLCGGFLRITMPSEAEWEKGARGDDGRIFPWGSLWDPRRTNSRVQPSAVGCFPLGVSPYGVFDMSGDMGEWTRSLRRRYPYVAVDGREDQKPGKTAGGKLRVLRGGSCFDRNWFVRCAARFMYSQDNCHENLGFRVVASPYRVVF